MDGSDRDWAELEPCSEEHEESLSAAFKPSGKDLSGQSRHGILMTVSLRVTIEAELGWKMPPLRYLNVSSLRAN